MRSKALHFRHFSATRAIKKKDDSQIGRKPVIGEEFSPNVKKSVDPKGLPAAFEQRSAALPLQTAPPESISKFYPASPAFEGEESSSAGISSSSNPSLRLNFDSSRYVDMLKAEGFSDAEANGLISLISEVVEDSMQASTTSLVPKGEQRRYLDECLKDLKLIKADVSNLEFRDFANLKKSIEQIKTEVEVSKTGMATDLSRIHAGARLDMNLEKSRIQLEAVDLQKQLKAAEDKIDLQIDKLETRMNAIRKSTRNGTSRFLLSCFTLLVSVRLFMLYQQSG